MTPGYQRSTVVATIHDVRRVAVAFFGFGLTTGLLLGWWLL